MKLVQDSPFNSQKPFENLFAPEFDINTKNLLNSQAIASTNSEQTLAPLPANESNSAEDIASFSNSLSLSPRFPVQGFTPPRRK